MKNKNGFIIVVLSLLVLCSCSILDDVGDKNAASSERVLSSQQSPSREPQPASSAPGIPIEQAQGSGPTSTARGTPSSPVVQKNDSATGAIKPPIPFKLTELRRLAEQFIRDNSADFPEWRGAKLSSTVHPVYRPDMQQIAYYEFPVARPLLNSEAGFVLLATAAHDNRVAQWATEGESNCGQLLKAIGSVKASGARCYILDIFSFAIEDNQGQLINVSGDPSGTVTKQNWAAYKRGYKTRYAEMIDAQAALAANDWQAAPKSVNKIGYFCDDNWSYHYAGTADDQRYYWQMGPNESPNRADCASGCGATAWAMLFGWVDYRASQNDPVWKQSWGMFGGVNEVAPKDPDADVWDMTMEIRRQIKTRCAPGEQGLTYPWDMKGAKQYLSSRTNSSPTLTVHYSQIGRPNNSLRDRADEAIRAGRPVVIMLGWEHYVVAWGYRKKHCSFGSDKHEFRINTGYGYNRWTSASTALVGQVKPYPVVDPAPTCLAGKKLCYYTPKGSPFCVADNQACPDYPDSLSGCPAGQVCCEPGGKTCARCVRDISQCIKR